MSDREGHGHKAVLYKSHFPPLRRSFYQRHHCIHRLINHVYYKDQTPLLFIAQRQGPRSRWAGRYPLPEQHSMYLLCGGQYASCVQAGGLSCVTYGLSGCITELSYQQEHDIW